LKAGHCRRPGIDTEKAAFSSALFKDWVGGVFKEKFIEALDAPV